MTAKASRPLSQRSSVRFTTMAGGGGIGGGVGIGLERACSRVSSAFTSGGSSQSITGIRALPGDMQGIFRGVVSVGVCLMALVGSRQLIFILFC
jgi:hypothetical protein